MSSIKKTNTVTRTEHKDDFSYSEDEHNCDIVSSCGRNVDGAIVKTSHGSAVDKRDQASR